MKYPFIAAVVGLLLSNCASIVSKRDYPVSITSNPSGCKVMVKKEDGSVVHQGVTPTSIVLPASSGFFKPASYTLEFSKKGLPTQTVPVKAGMDGWYLGNIVFGGLVGLLVVDPLTGAMWKLDPTMNADLTPLAEIDAGNGRSLKVVDKASLPVHFEKQLVALR